MDKPLLIQQLEKFIAVEHKLGKSEDAIVADMSEAARWIADQIANQTVRNIVHEAITS